MSKHEQMPEVPNADQVLAALARIVASSVFRSSPQIAAFLTFVVKAVLEGKGDRIKGYTIGVEVLRREETFDPQIDPIVRVEATRLRRALDRYYAGPGQSDSVILTLPRGSYAPTFKLRTDALDDPDAKYHLLDQAAKRRLTFVASIAGIIFVAAAAWKLYSSIGGAPKQTGSIVQSDDKLLSGNGMPVLLVQPPTVVGIKKPNSVSAESLYVRAADAFSRFDLINVRRQSIEESQQPGQQANPRSQVDFRLVGRIEYLDDGTARLRIELIDALVGNLVWSQVFDRVGAEANRNNEEERIVRQLAETLVSPFGVIYSVERGKSLRKSELDPRYACIIDAVETFRSFDPLQLMRARSCLNRLTSIYPNFGIGFTYLAAMDLREYQYRVDLQADEMPPLDRALRAARRGVELNPESSRAYEILFVTLFARHELAAAFSAGEKAMSLNMYDKRLVGALGARRIAAGDIEVGLALLKQAEADGRIIPAFEQFFLFLGNYLRGDMSHAAFHANQLTGDSFQLAFLARGLMDYSRGDQSSAAKAFDRLAAINPAWRKDLTGSLRRFFEDNSIVDRLTNDLTAAGITKNR
jgi:hypothetical protein